MKPICASLLSCLLLLSPVAADELNPDLQAPRPPGNFNLRVLLYIPGSPRLLDYPNVCKVLCSEPARIIFETTEGYVVTHLGGYTIIQPKTSLAGPAAPGAGHRDGPLFYDPK